MNGSTNGVVGFNPEDAKATLMFLDDSYAYFCYSVSSKLEVLAKVIFGHNNTNTGWYAPEAVKFEKEVMLPAYESICNRIYKLYEDIWNKTLAAIKKWDQTTGSKTSIPTTSDPLSIANGSVYYKQVPFQRWATSTDKNGNIRIDLMLPQLIRNAWTDTMSPNARWYDSRVDMSIINRAPVKAFLGENQMNALWRVIEHAGESIKEELHMIYERAAVEIQKSVDKYQAIAKSVAGSFGGSSTSSASGSTSNNFNRAN